MLETLRPTARKPVLHKTGLAKRTFAPGAVLVAVLVSAGGQQARALDVLPDEKATRVACERRLCSMVLDPELVGPPLACDMKKTWDRTKIKKNGEKSSLSWGFGDARCELKIDIPRKLLMPAIADPKYTLFVPPQTVTCKVEDSSNKLSTLDVIVSPKIKFRGGRAYKVWLNVKDVRGNSDLTTLVWTVSKLADGLGIFHSATVKEINKFLHVKCPAEYGPKSIKANAKPKSKPDLKADAQ